MKKIFFKLKYYCARPGHLFKPYSYTIRKIYYYLSIWLHPRTFLSRKKFQKSKSIDFKINSGFLKIENFYNLKLDYSHINSLKDKIDLTKNLPIYDLMKDEDFDTTSEVFKLATSEKIINIVSDYLGFTPILTKISLWYSPNLESFDQSSQSFHLDHEDVSQVKCFFLIEDVNSDMGPTQIINVEKSKYILKKTNYKITKEKKRISDDKIKELVNENDIMACTGKKNTIYFLDKSRCIHAGSKKSKKPRLVLFFQYISPFSNHLDWIWRRSGILNKPKWINNDLTLNQKKVLGQKI